jgi:hypothetical protein
MNKKTSSYNPAEVSLIFGTHTVQGYADGTFIEVEQSNESFSLVKGADGEAARVRSNDDSGTIKVTLMQSSDSNMILSMLHQADKKTGKGTLPVIFKDASGDSIGAGPVAWIQKPANIGFSKGIENREWTIVVAHLEMLAGGNPAI